MPKEAGILRIENRHGKGLTFADAYGLGLLSKIPGGAEHVEIFEYLSPNAKRIAGAFDAPSDLKKRQRKKRNAAKKK